MKKIYQTPHMDITTIQIANNILQVSGKYESGSDGTVLTREQKTTGRGYGSGLWEDMQ